MTRMLLFALAGFAIGWVCCAIRMNLRIRRLIGDAQAWAREATDAWNENIELKAQVDWLRAAEAHAFDEGWQSGANVRVDLGGQP